MYFEFRKEILVEDINLWVNSIEVVFKVSIGWDYRGNECR